MHLIAYIIRAWLHVFSLSQQIILDLGSTVNWKHGEYI